MANLHQCLRLLTTIVLLLALSACTPAPQRPEEVALNYARDHFGEKSFDPDGQGYEINVLKCGRRWCVALYPARSAQGMMRWIGGGVEIELQRDNLRVVKAIQTQ